MKRLVYSPKVAAYIKADSGIIDISDYITAGGVERKLDQVSSAKLTIRNPNMKWTDVESSDPVSGETLLEPMFHPMDPITIFMTRLQNRPVQVFTGFLDKTPYLQLHPGTIDLRASCTLKKLQYTFFDAGLPFFNEFLVNEGWNVVEGVGIVNQKEPAQGEAAKAKGVLTDTGFGKLLLTVLEDIGGWPKETIYIEEIPPGLIELVTELFESGSKEAEESNQFLIKLLHKIIGTAALGEGELSTGTGKPGEGGQGTFPVEGTLVGAGEYTAFSEQMASETGLSLRVIGAWCVAEGGPIDNPLNIGPGDHFGTAAKAAEASSDNLKTDLYKEVMASVGKTDQKQIHAIAISPWCGEAGYEALILGVYNTRVKVIKNK